ncbi:MAG: hypothetical protein Q7Q71_06115 [Verrucomicrobiota bacterium JB023]|nr:hypothetical protein [Verrucomicrobiota bacterium JB023]
MNKKLMSLAGLGLLALASCTAPYGSGMQQMTPRADVEAVERQAPVTPAPSNAASARNAVDYGLDRRYGYGYYPYSY